MRCCSNSGKQAPVIRGRARCGVCGRVFEWKGSAECVLPEHEPQSRNVRDIDKDRETWHSGPYPSSEAREIVRNGFTHMIRAADDPEPESREAKRARMYAEGVEDPYNEIAQSMQRKIDVAAHVEQVIALLSDGRARTLNRIGIELWHRTADTVDDRVWHGVVDAVEAGRIEHSCHAPILLRLPQRIEQLSLGGIEP